MRLELLGVLALWLGLSVPAMGAVSRATSCSDLLTAEAQRRTYDLEADDLARLRDIGPPEGTAAGPGLLSLSPNGRSIAIQIRRADPISNSYCIAMVVIDAQARARPLIIDEGTAPITDEYDDLWGLSGWPTGWPRDIQPRWSPDGKWVAFLKREGRFVQVWRARADGAGSEALTRSPADVIDFAWMGQSSIVFSTRPDRAPAESAIAQEGLVGFLFDDRFNPLSRDRPMVRAGAPLAAFVAEIESGTVRVASPMEAERIGLGPRGGPPPPILSAAANASYAWVSKRDPSRYESPTMLSVTRRDGTTAHCAAAPCDKIVDLWFQPRGGPLLFLGRSGWGKSRMGLYRWAGNGSDPEKILETDDLLVSCTPSDGPLFCLREGSSRPRHIVAINPANGRSRSVFDPNPDFGRLRLGKVIRLHWRNDRDIECFGDLVLPPTHRPGEKHPLIVVQYQSRGLLRGGTGDEYPIFWFAARGYAVLSLQRPPEIGGLLKTSDQDEFERENIAGWADRRSVFSALRIGIDRAVALGVVDRSRIGLTGLSDGVSTVIHALLNSNMFRAVSISQCCDDEKIQTLYTGLQASSFRARTGYPLPGEERPDFWADHSLAKNVQRLDTAILVQVSQDEYRSALESWSVLRRYAVPVEMYVFPDEHHIKWQPAHRLAIYRRNLAWFDFWLRDVEDSSPERHAEILRWRELKRAKQARP